MQVDILIAVLLCVAGLVIGGGAAGFIAFRMGVNHRRQTAEALIGSAEAEAERIKHEAEAAAEASKKEKLLEAKDEIHRLRNESEKELKERRVDVQRQERRIQQKPWTAKSITTKKRKRLSTKNSGRSMPGWRMLKT